MRKNTKYQIKIKKHEKNDSTVSKYTERKTLLILICKWIITQRIFKTSGDETNENKQVKLGEEK